ncbi:cytochrome c oxidase subunit NDUFA4-like [Solea senegalensis]|uniref:Cytochrome c oxidase subunit NDUFA4-like n=1 Tax=Solea senegalensis TaxID=28829 RepID=A0AAV6QMU0_SOLSE|nr:cytochrome c oxidase subunit NDUFA4 isoform X2 [Solea senegalensis]KAG7494347.1 cytochrome c oxidase subunit NDUFA4-like [Solea senegalensis]
MFKTILQHAKKHPGLIPQFIFTSLGLTGALLYLIRLSRGPHVTLWDKKNNPEPWNKLDPTYQYKSKERFLGFSRLCCLPVE